MPPRLDRRIVLAVAFLLAGLCVLYLPYTLPHLLWVVLLFPHGFRPILLYQALGLGQLVGGCLLCLLTASGLKHGKPWARWTGVCACATLVSGFPWFTIASAAGLYILLVDPPRLEAAPRRGGSRKGILVVPVACLLGFLAWRWAVDWAQRMGMPPFVPSWEFLLLYPLVFSVLQTAMHEFGHAVVAWAFEFRIRLLYIGPFLFWKDWYGSHWRVEWKRLFSSDSGYAGAVPSKEAHMRIGYVAMIAGGPAASLLGGLVFLAVFVCLPGTPLQHWWRAIAFNCVMGFGIALGSLIPTARSDGGKLWNMARRTAKGRSLFRWLHMALADQEAEAYHDSADFERSAALREKALAIALESEAHEALEVVQCHASLGVAKQHCGDLFGAAAQFRKCLDVEAVCETSPWLAARAWSGLGTVSESRHQAADARNAYDRALELRQKEQPASLDGLWFAAMGLGRATAHQHLRDFESALDEIREAVRALPNRRDRLLLLTMIRSVQAECELELGHTDRAVAAAQCAAEIVRSGEIPRERQNLAWYTLIGLAGRMGRTGQSAITTDLLREAVAGLEAGGATSSAAVGRCALAFMLRRSGQVDAAFEALPKEDGLSVFRRRHLLNERAHIHMEASRAAEAVADARALLALWRAEPDPPALETALAESLLAWACLAAGETKEAEALAQSAGEVLRAWPHPDAAACVITLALAREWAPACIDEARRVVESDPLLTPREKALCLDKLARYLERHGRAEAAQAMRASRGEKVVRQSAAGS